MYRKFMQRVFLLTLTLSLSFFYNISHGSTIAQIGTDELINRSELIFEGTVISVESELNEFGRVYTFVEFSVEDVLAGSITASPTITLRFTGGIAGGVELDLGVRVPQLNESGIYFVEKVAPGLINPLLGWEQGHFLVNNSGTVVAANSLEVSNVELRRRSNSPLISSGVALGINTRQLTTSDSVSNASEFSKPMTVLEFKDRIRELMN
jgi:hypothetical protein